MTQCGKGLFVGSYKPYIITASAAKGYPENLAGPTNPTGPKDPTYVYPTGHTNPTGPTYPTYMYTTGPTGPVGLVRLLGCLGYVWPVGYVGLVRFVGCVRPVGLVGCGKVCRVCRTCNVQVSNDSPLRLSF